MAVAPVGIGCWGSVAANEPLARYDPSYGYRPDTPGIGTEVGEIDLNLAFSGGGIRAAALAYGVMQALHETRVVRGGETRPLLDEVDSLSGVSGGSFPAAYYGLFGDRIFDDFEQRFLRRDIQGSILWRSLIPWNLIALATPWLTRSQIAAGIFHESVFEGASFQSLVDAKGPFVAINATDLSSGERFTFTQDQFDVICSDLQRLPISVAVAASSAVPVVLAPIDMRNHAGTCGYEPDTVIQEALRQRRTNPRGYRAARSLAQLDDPAKKYLHLVDGAISDNLALRYALDTLAMAGGMERAFGYELADVTVLISVNAESGPDPSIDLSSAAPGLAAMMQAVSGGQIRRYNFETLLLSRELMDRMVRDARAAGHDVAGIVVDVSFENFGDERDRAYFERIPTSFDLDDEQVDQLIWAGRELLLSAPEFQRLVRHVGATMPESAPRPPAESD